ncbi:MAG: HYExAFE family protein [Planctomycetota bacterium]
MASRRHHYERAFEAYLRATRRPYVSVNEARRALLPPNADLSVRPIDADGTHGEPETLKSFDFVIYSEPANLLLEIKGRRVGRGNDLSLTTAGRLESWVTEDDVTALSRWQVLFRGGSAETDFRAAFVFVYWCSVQPPDALFQEIFDYQGRWYAMRLVMLDDYAEHMKPRSRQWRTVDLPRAAFEACSRTLASATAPGPSEASELEAMPVRTISPTPALSRELADVMARRQALRAAQQR